MAPPKQPEASAPPRIVDVGHKPAVPREAEARGLLSLRPATLAALRRGEGPKGDPFPVARAAGLLAVKRTPELLPLCHPIPLSGAEVHLAVVEGGVEARCIARATHTTGVEMDALTGCAVALLTVWDMVKALEKDDAGQYPATALQDLRVVRKAKGPEGADGRMSHHQHKGHAPQQVRVALVTVSDTRSPATDASGVLLRDLLRAAGHDAAEAVVVKDEAPAIRAALEDALASPAQAVVLNGGTGVSPRDVTIETVAPLLDKQLPGFGELFRMLSFQEVGSAAMMSRALAGVSRGKVVVALPGSPAAVRLAVERLLLPELGHLVGEAVKGTGREGDPLA